MSNSSRITQDNLYFYKYFDRFTVDILRDDLILRGYVTDIADNGLIVDFHHEGQSLQTVDFSQVRLMPTKCRTAERYCKKIFAINSQVEVLLRPALDQPQMWTPTQILEWVPVYPPEIHQYTPSEDGPFVLVRIPSGSTSKLAAVKNDRCLVYANAIRIRQRRFWKTATRDSFTKVLVRHEACSLPDCPYPHTPLLYALKRLDVAAKRLWLESTGTLILAADESSITVLCRGTRKKRREGQFHRLIFHQFGMLIEEGFCRGMAHFRCLLFTQRMVDEGGTAVTETWFTKTCSRLRFFPDWLRSQTGGFSSIYNHKEPSLPLIGDVPDLLILEIFANLDKVAETDLRRVCWRWNTLQSSKIAARTVILDAPHGYVTWQDMMKYLATALINYTDTFTHSVLLNQFFHSHNYAALLVITQLNLPLKYFLSYRKTSQVCLKYELEMYPAVSNMQISCVMKTKDATKRTLGVMLGASDEIKSMLADSHATWTYCCTTKRMSDTITGIPLMLTAFNTTCLAQTYEAAGKPYGDLYQAGQTRLQDARRHWPITPSATGLLEIIFSNFAPTYERRGYPFSYAEDFVPESLKVLIRNPRMERKDRASSPAVESWLLIS
ncbi:uncharacterized protein LOC129592693 isoform X2 [Paramacrobiotus metropolitanus]|uniref:uncharacterized protein LOC129592693 isoform X2 n=1 Tax=Paramacrobiotus metropolitanus TaxID=2943436 RepID=UPI0024465CD4|nr:uncharacterized protein LOC129592693 isoform X2 [Paramacrobiotus metropolitanus]